MANSTSRDKQSSPQGGQPFWQLRAWEWVLLAAALLLFAVQSYTVIPRESATFDEQYHLTAGYSYLRTGDFRLASNHPPLMGMLGGLGLLSKQDVTLALDDPAWDAGDRYRFSDVFLWESNDRAQEFLVAARRMMLLVGLFCCSWRSFLPRARWSASGAAGWRCCWRSSIPTCSFTRAL